MRVPCTRCASAISCGLYYTRYSRGCIKPVLWIIRDLSEPVLYYITEIYVFSLFLQNIGPNMDTFSLTPLMKPAWYLAMMVGTGRLATVVSCRQRCICTQVPPPLLCFGKFVKVSVWTVCLSRVLSEIHRCRCPFHMESDVELPDAHVRISVFKW